MLGILQKQFSAHSILCQSSSIFSLTSFMSKQCVEWSDLLESVLGERERNLI